MEAPRRDAGGVKRSGGGGRGCYAPAPSAHRSAPRPRARARAEAPEGPLRLATWNVNGLRARLDFLRLWLRERRPDVVGLQELKLEDAQFPRDEIAEEGYDALVHGQRSWNGVAILARREAGAVELARDLPGQEELGARLISARVLDIDFTTLYVPNGKDVQHEDFPRKLAWLDALVAHAASAAGRPAVLCGDFNLCPAPLDSWNEAELSGSLFHTDEERSRFRRLLAPGFHDVLREQHPDRATFSWWDYRGGAFHRGWGLRIDLVLATDPVARRVRSAEIDRDFRKKKDALVPSDHAPVIVDLD
ncbi:MAG: exodeoxyribonuclease III [bacterium]